MHIIPIILPKMGESIYEATLIKWLKKKGDVVQKDEPIAEVATDKVDSEVVATENGVVEDLLFNENDIIPVGATMMNIQVKDNSTSLSKTTKKEIIPAATQITETIKTPSPTKITYVKAEKKQEITTGENNNKKYKIPYLSPLVKKIIEKEKISQTEILNIKGTGQKNRITKEDIYLYLLNKNQSIVENKEKITDIEKINAISEETSLKKPIFQENSIIPTSGIKIPIEQNNQQDDKIIEMDRMRKLIAQHMIHSKRTSAHVTSFAEINVTNIVKWRKENKDKIFKTHNIKLTYTPIFLEAITKSLLNFPLINSTILEDKIYIKKNIHLGLATALPNNNLIVPIIKFAEQYNLLGLAMQIQQLSEAARKGMLLPDQIQGGTFTVTNLGSINMMMGTPIIHQPQVAILGIGSILKKPIIKETQDGDTIGIGNIMYLSFSYDHRIIDGKLAGDFLNHLTHQIENFIFPSI